MRKRISRLVLCFLAAGILTVGQAALSVGAEEKSGVTADSKAGASADAKQEATTEKETEVNHEEMDE